MKKRHLVVGLILVVAASSSAYLAVAATSSDGGATKSVGQVVSGNGGIEAIGSTPIVEPNSGGSQSSSALPPLVSRPQGSPLEPGTDLASASPAAIAGALQADLNNLVSDDLSDITLDNSTNGPALAAFLRSQQSRLSYVSIVPTVISTALLSSGSLAIEFTVVVTFMGGTWPTNLGTLDATLNPQGTILMPHSTLCSLASPITSTCPF